MADELAFWQAGADVAATPATFAHTTTRRSSVDTVFRLRNMSTLYSANDVVIGVEDWGDTVEPTMAHQHLLSTDGRVFTATVTVGTLDPGVTTDRLYLRHVCPSDAPLGAHPIRITANATTWS